MPLSSPSSRCCRSSLLFLRLPLPPTTLSSSAGRRSSTSTAPAWYSLFFYPQDLTIAYGDSVTWVWNSGEVHNVVFSGDTILSETNPDGTLNPIAGEVGNQTHFVDPTALYSSGIRNNFVQPATLTFIPNDGGGVTYPYYCSIHASSGMIANLTVLPEGQLAPLTPEQINATIDGLIAGLEAFATQEITAIEAAAPATGPGVTHTQLADGTNEWTVIGGAMFMNGNESMYARFLPSYIEINLNDTITWIVNGGDPHYVYFQIDNVWPVIYAKLDTQPDLPSRRQLVSRVTRIQPQPYIRPYHRRAHHLIPYCHLSQPDWHRQQWPHLQ